mgnify:CR=1 FL=1
MCIGCWRVRDKADPDGARPPRRPARLQSVPTPGETGLPGNRVSEMWGVRALLIPIATVSRGFCNDDVRVGRHGEKEQVFQQDEAGFPRAHETNCPNIMDRVMIIEALAISYLAACAHMGAPCCLSTLHSLKL